MATSTKTKVGSSLGAFLDAAAFNQRHAIVVGICGLTFMFETMDWSMLPLVAPAISKEWGLAGSGLGVVLSAVVFGMLIGSYLFGMITDRFGRRLGLQATIVLVTVATTACGFVNDPIQLAIARFFVGVGIGGFTPVDAAVLSEFIPARFRGRAIAFTFIFSPLGGFAAAGLALLVVPIWGWRGLFIIGAAPVLLVLIARWLIPETPRFLLSRGRDAEAARSAAWISGASSVPQFDRAEAGLNQRQRPLSMLSQVKVLFSPTYRARTVFVWTLWLAFIYSYYGLLFWLPTLLTQYKDVPRSSVYAFMMGFTVVGVIGRIVCTLVIDRFGRRRVIAVGAFGAAILLPVFGMQEGLTELIIGGYTFAFFQDLALCAFIPYAPELYPTSIRATGVGWAAGAGRISGTIAPIAIGALAAQGVTMIFGMLALSYVVAGVTVVFFGPETTGRPLDELEVEEANRLAKKPASDPVATLV